MKLFFKIFAFVFALLCLTSAYLQLNDPDLLLWLCIYITSGIVSILFALNRLPYQIYLVLSIGYVIGAFLFWPETFEGVTIGGGEISNIEHARESLGLIILALVMLIFGIRTKTN
ncbi:transmembrane 220 family protein [Winogradskyella sp. PG-2]|uniref:transmembrane 220 family protein n=1 Tax=Winogradskyella sp. PG-2 TaxID=754409 RepID=UPI00045875AC|nr:transmembrane 220 family protein [Winogradskyella sp. PG-2]BAO75280.1 hypothetical protein WPG_1050 [Winogradskyella sp. PG-2]